MTESEGPVFGRVRDWYDEEGWGVIDSPSTPGGCWTHFSAVEADGFRSLRPGSSVEFRWEAAEQDGYNYRTTWVRGT
jgi:CspA family cold shock protein